MEYIVLETGLGGRLDATNAIGRPLISVITSIGLDHTAILGDTLEEIAVEKGGDYQKGSAGALCRRPRGQQPRNREESRRNWGAL